MCVCVCVNFDTAIHLADKSVFAITAVALLYTTLYMSLQLNTSSFWGKVANPSVSISSKTQIILSSVALSVRKVPCDDS